MTAFQNFIERKIKLPSPPAIALNILATVKKDETTYEDLAKIIKADPALTARTLKIANSSLYGLTKKIESLQQATALLGPKTVQNIALSFAIFDTFQDTHQGEFDLEHFWKRAISTAVSAELLAKYTRQNHQDIFVTALLQDIGILILFLSAPEAFAKMLDEKRVHGKTTLEAEKQTFGFNHPETGAYLLEEWNLPDSIHGPIRFHHSSDNSLSEHRDAATLLQHADILAAIYHSTQSNKKFIKAHNELAAFYGFDSEKTNNLIDEIGEKAREMIKLFALDPGEVKSFSQIMQEANDELSRLNFSYEQVVLELKKAKQKAEKLATELKDANYKLRDLAFQDDLTGLYNHRYFQEMLELEIQRTIRYKHPLSLILLDIDYFKKVNDTYGHPVGDLILREISKKMIQLVRRCDIVCRYGGEEFTIILPEIGKTGAKLLAQRLRKGIEQHLVTTGTNEISVTVSIGFSSTDMVGTTTNRIDLIARSDEALYQAKQNGRNRVEP